MSADPANMWHQFFGPPIGEIKTNPYDKYQYETYTLPDAYSGKNIFLRDTIEGFIQENNTWYTNVCLPTQITDQIHLRWNAFHFDQALASVVPEEASILVFVVVYHKILSLTQLFLAHRVSLASSRAAARRRSKCLFGYLKFSQNYKIQC